MNNIFITKNETGIYQPNYDYKFRANLVNFLSSKINSRDEYVAWVHQWRAYEKELVEAIKFFRSLKKEATDLKLKDRYHRYKLSYKPTAREFYEFRREKKEFFKNSEFFQLNKNTDNKVKEPC